MNNPQLPPWAWFMQPGLQQQQQSTPLLPDIIVPARVDKALEFLAILSQKTMCRAAANDISIEILPGQILSDEEANAQATACNLLSKYFAGGLTPDVWEEIKVRAAQHQADHINTTGHLLHCIACQPGPPRADCPICSGSGRILVTSVGPVVAGPNPT